MIRAGARGITRPARTKRGRTGIRAKASPKGRLGLDGQGLQAPNEGKKCQPVTAGETSARDGSRMAETVRGGLGSRQPARASGALFLNLWIDRLTYRLTVA